MTHTIAFHTPPAAPKWRRWLVYSPLARILIFMLLFGGLAMLMRWATLAAGWTVKDSPPAIGTLGILLRQLVPSIAAYLMLVLLLERRRPTELLVAKPVRDLSAGLLAGVVLITTVIGTLWLAGVYQVSGNHLSADIARAFWVGSVGAAIAEELLFRGVLFRATEEGLGTIAALVVSALFFGLAHYGNKNATVWSSVAIAVEAGLLLGLVYHVWRSLPVCIGLHAGWNFVQGPVFGSAVSGHGGESWLRAELRGPEWLTGGAFGVEASVVAVAVCVLASLLMLRLARQRATLVPWRPLRRAPAAAPAAPHNLSMPAESPPC